MTEAELIAALRIGANDPAARGLNDDAAVLEIGDTYLILTHDMIIEGIHYLPDDPPADVAWKLLAINLSDLAAKGAAPVGVLLGYMLGEDEWDRAFAEALCTALAAFALPLLGGDTVAGRPGTPRALGLTAIGRSEGPVPSRAGARPGDGLWVTGTIGDAGAGLAVLRGEIGASSELVERYRNPRPRLEAGQKLARIVDAMMDVSDGLLIDSSRMAKASDCSAMIELDDVPLSATYLEKMGGELDQRMAACTAGDDYELLFAAPAEAAREILAMAEDVGLPFTRIGRFNVGNGLSITDRGEPVELPRRLGFEHRG